MSPCPHCGALARSEASPFFRFRCGVCGGPMVPTEDIARSGQELPSLVRAQRARAMALGWLSASWLFAGIAVFAGGLGLLVFAAAHATALTLLVTAAAASLVAWRTRAGGSRRNAEARQETDAAWQAVARDVLRARGPGLAAAELARIMHTDEAQGELLLANISVDAMLRVEAPAETEPKPRIATDEAQDAEPGPNAQDKAQKESS